MHSSSVQPSLECDSILMMSLSGFDPAARLHMSPVSANSILHLLWNDIMAHFGSRVASTVRLIFYLFFLIKMKELKPKET